MKTNLTKSVRAGSACPLFTAAALVLAMAFTFGCSDDTGGGTPNGGGGGGNCPNAVTTAVNAEGIGSVSCGGQVYKTVKIGEQVWMAENSNFNAEGSRCYGDKTGGDSQDKCGTYGRLYDWATAMNLPGCGYGSSCASQISTKHRGICPNGWHIPNVADINVLMEFVNPSCSPYGNFVFTCKGAGTKLKASSGWNSHSGTPTGTDDYGFSALPGGYGYSTGGSDDAGFHGWWQIASEYNANSAYLMGMTYDADDAGWGVSSKGYLNSVRCVQD